MGEKKWNFDNIPDSYLVFQSPNIAIHLLLLDEGLLIHTATPIDEELTWAEFMAIWLHSCSPMTAEYLIAREDAS